jgi:hypothetical protein
MPERPDGKVSFRLLRVRDVQRREVTIQARCSRCRTIREVNKAMLRRFGLDAKVHELECRLQCRSCGSRDCTFMVSWHR